MKTFKTLTMIFAAMAIVCSSADASSVGLNAAISGLRILSGSSVFYPEADVDGNKKVEMNDVILSLQIVAGLRGGFPDIVLAVANGMNSIKLAWLPAGANYEVHLSETDNFEPSAATLKKTVSANQADIDGLVSGKTYYALIVATDSSGSRLRSRKTVSVTTLSKPVIVSTTQKYSDAAALGLANPVITGAQYSYPKTATSTPPEVGSILMSADGLKKVSSVNVTADSIIIQTTDAELTQAVHQGKISNKLVMFEDSSNPALSTRDSDGSISKTMRWDDDLLVVQQKDFSETEKNKREDGQSAGVDVTLGFEPEFQTDIEWEGDAYTAVRLTKCRIVGKCTFNAGINAWYKFAASGSASKDIQILKRTYTSVYSIGTVPVYQEITLSVNAVFSASASAKIEANANAKASTSVEMGVEYNSATGAWDKVFSSGFEKSVTVNMSVQGGVYGEVRLIPQIEVKFYKVAAAYLTLEPFLYGDIQAQADYYADILAGFGYGGAQLTKCEFGLKAESYVGVTLSALKQTFTVLGKTKLWESDPWLLFTLPTLTAPEAGSIATVNKGTSVTVSVEDGTNNPFNDSTVRWYVYPNTGGYISVTGRTATFTPTEKGSYTIFFSGENRLGAVGRQFVKTVVIATPYAGPPMHGVPYRYHGVGDNCLNIKRCPTVFINPCLDDCKISTCIMGSIADTASYQGAWDSNCDLVSYTEFSSKDGTRCTRFQQGKYIGCDNGVCSLWNFAPIYPDEPPLLYGYSGRWYQDSCKPYRGGETFFGNYKGGTGKLDGTVIVFNPDGLTTTRGVEYAMQTWTNGRLNGPTGVWNIETGQPYHYGTYVNGWLGYSGGFAETRDRVMDGIWTHIFYKMDNGSETEEVVSYRKESYKANVRDGAHGEWLADGTPRPDSWHGNYVNGNKDGVWTYYCNNGKTYTQTWANGVSQGISGNCN